MTGASPLASAAAAGAREATAQPGPGSSQTAPTAPHRTPRMVPSVGTRGDMAALPALARSDSPTGSPRSASISLQAAATMNAGLQHELSRRSSSSSMTRARQSPQTGRRRSVVLMNLHHNDPTLPAPGEMVTENRHSSPRGSFSESLVLPVREHGHSRTPSLGELHQELESEQEAQVNRLLQMIRQQQLQLQHLQNVQSHGSSTAVHSDGASAGASAGAEQSGQGTPVATSASQSSSSMMAPHAVSQLQQIFASPVTSAVRSPGHPRSSFDMARADLQRRSRTPSRNASPRLRSTSIEGEGSIGGGGIEPCVLGVRDESAFYQAETQMLVRENQMLRHRIRELEKQLSELTAPLSALTREPAHHSHLSQSLLATQPLNAESAETDDKPAVAGDSQAANI